MYSSRKMGVTFKRGILWYGKRERFASFFHCPITNLSITRLYKMSGESIESLKKSILDRLNAKIRQSRDGSLNEGSDMSPTHSHSHHRHSDSKIDSSHAKSKSPVLASLLPAPLYRRNSLERDDQYISKMRDRIRTIQEASGVKTTMAIPGKIETPGSKKSSFQAVMDESHHSRSGSLRGSLGGISSTSKSSDMADMARIQGSGRVRDFLAQHRLSVEANSPSRPPWQKGLGSVGPGAATSARLSKPALPKGAYVLKGRDSASPPEEDTKRKPIRPVSRGPKIPVRGTKSSSSRAATKSGNTPLSRSAPILTRPKSILKKRPPIRPISAQSSLASRSTAASRAKSRRSSVTSATTSHATTSRATSRATSHGVSQSSRVTSDTGTTVSTSESESVTSSSSSGSDSESDRSIPAQQATKPPPTPSSVSTPKKWGIFGGKTTPKPASHSPANSKLPAIKAAPAPPPRESEDHEEDEHEEPPAVIPTPAIKKKSIIPSIVATPKSAKITSKVSASNFENEDEERPSGPPAALSPCHFCSRSFQTDRLEKHETICQKASQKRKVFDSTKMRIEGTDIEQGPKGIKGRTQQQQRAPKDKGKWREKHEELIRTMREAKKITAILAAGGKASDLPPSAPSENTGRPCPTCERKFGESSWERHVSICKNLKNVSLKRKN